MAYSYTTYTGDGSTTQFNIPFSYLLPEHVTLIVDGDTVDAAISGSNMVADDAPADDAVVTVQRTTPVDDMLTDFANGATMSEADLDGASLQLLYIAQELQDAQALLTVGATPTSNLIYGTAGARPAAGTAGRVYAATDTYQMSYDNGATWVNLSPAHTGDVTSAAGSNVLAIAASAVGSAELAAAAVTLAKMANLEADKIIGSIAGGTPEAIACTATGRSLIAIASAAAGRTVLAAGPSSQIRFRADRNGVDQTSIAHATYTKVAHNNQVIDSDATYDPSVNYRFTPGVAGTFGVVASIKITNLADGKYANAAIFKNGVIYSKSRAYSGDAGEDLIVQVADFIALDADDYIEAYVYHNHGSARDLDGDTDSTFFTAVRVSE